MALYELYNHDKDYIYTHFSDEISEVQNFLKCAHYRLSAGNEGVARKP